MKVAEITKKLKEENIDVTKLVINKQYILRLSNKSTLHINYTNDKNTNIQVFGIPENVKQTKNILGIKE
jgi:hypothetical protein